MPSKMKRLQRQELYALISVFDSMLFSSTAYRLYKKRCARVSADEDSEAPALEADNAELGKAKRYGVENGAFELDENGNGEEKGKNMDKNTQL